MWAPFCSWKWEKRKRKRCWLSDRNVQLSCTRKLAFSVMNWKTWAVTYLSRRHLINVYLYEVLPKTARSTLTHIFINSYGRESPLAGVPLNGVFRSLFTRFSGDHLYCIRISSNTTSWCCYVNFFRFLSINPLTPNDLWRRCAVSPLKIKNPSKNMREKPTNTPIIHSVYWLCMVAPTYFGITFTSSGSVPSAFWDMLNWGAVAKILWMGVLCLVTWCMAISDINEMRGSRSKIPSK
jgi:hypothetical protein